MKSELQKAQEQAWKEAIAARKKSNAATGDFYRSIAMRDLHDTGKVKNAPQATMKPQSKAQLAVNRIKRAQKEYDNYMKDKMQSKITKMWSDGVSQIKDAGKKFVNNIKITRVYLNARQKYWDWRNGR